jgi:hypothetical protein
MQGIDTFEHISPSRHLELQQAVTAGAAAAVLRSQEAFCNGLHLLPHACLPILFVFIEHDCHWSLAALGFFLTAGAPCNVQFESWGVNV